MSKLQTAKLNEHLQQIIQFAPMLKKLFSADVAISISDLEKIVCHIKSKEVDVGDMLGYRLTERDPMIDVMRTKREFVVQIPKEQYGVAMKAAIVPILNLQGVVVGSLGVSSSIANRVNLMEIAESFASSSEEISASVEEMTESAQHLSDYMDKITSAQEDLTYQVANSSKILDMINTISKNTRILGFNAGIEAARSGEYGRGFAVVAKEITNLADKSGNSVNDIRQLLNSMQRKVEEVSQDIHQTQQITSAQSTAIIEISKAMQQLAEAAVTIDELAQKV